jgi:hypothetical protein
MDIVAALEEHGMLLQSARGPLLNVAEIVVGQPIKGSWWGHPRRHDIFRALQELDGSADTVRLRLVRAKVTFVHRRLWPALVRVAEHLTPEQLAARHEEHTESGAHRVQSEPFPRWVPDDVVERAADLTEEEAWAQLPSWLRP